LNGKEAMAVLEKWIPDVMILDLMLPDVDGFDFLSDIKKNDRLKSIPVLVASNLGQKEDMDRAMALGAADYVIKSDLSLGDLISKINALVPGKK